MLPLCPLPPGPLKIDQAQSESSPRGGFAELSQALPGYGWAGRQGHGQLSVPLTWCSLGPYCGGPCLEALPPRGLSSSWSPWRAEGLSQPGTRVGPLPAGVGGLHLALLRWGLLREGMWARVGLGRLCPAGSAHMHSWRKLKLEQAALFPAIQSQPLVFVCTRVLWVSGRMWSEVMIFRMEVSSFHGDLCCGRCCFVSESLQNGTGVERALQQPFLVVSKMVLILSFRRQLFNGM